MRKIFVASLAVGLLLSVGTAAIAQSPEPSANIMVGGQNFNLSSAITDTGTGFTLPSTSLALAGGSLITVGFTGDKDPSITYNFSVVNPTPNAMTYDFDLTIPVVPTVANSPTSASIFGSLTDGGDNGQVTVAPTDFGGLLRATGVDIYSVDHSLGLDAGPGATLGSGATDKGNSFNYGPYSKTGTSAFIITSLDVHVHFTLSGNGDAAAFNGRVSVTGAPSPQGLVPEPGSLALLGAMGVCVSGVTFRRRSRRI